MKKSNILGLILIAAGLAFIVSKAGDFSSRQTFTSAEKKPGKEFQIMATLDTINHDMKYDPIQDANRFEFYAIDESGETRKVVFSGAKPQDFERSEKLTMTGSMENGEFKCSKILMKCPSKYKNDQIVVGKPS